jgi:hypothetical protein
MDGIEKKKNEERTNDFPFLIIKNLCGCNKKNLTNRELFSVIIKLSLTC